MTTYSMERKAEILKRLYYPKCENIDEVSYDENVPKNTIAGWIQQAINGYFYIHYKQGTVNTKQIINNILQFAIFDGTVTIDLANIREMKISFDDILEYCDIVSTIRRLLHTIKFKKYNMYSAASSANNSVIRLSKMFPDDYIHNNEFKNELHRLEVVIKDIARMCHSYDAKWF